MMKLQAGIFLKSTPALDDSYFAGANIFITEYNNDGAVGFVINRPFNRSLNDLEEFKHSPVFLLYEGGPVDQEHLFFLHRRPDVVGEGSEVSSGLYSGGNFKQAVNGINHKSLSPHDIKIFVGYCGWDKGELEAEIEEGSWIVEHSQTDAIFGPVTM